MITHVNKIELAGLGGAICSGISYLSAIQLPSLQTCAYIVAMASGIFSIANVIYGWIEKRRANKSKQ